LKEAMNSAEGVEIENLSDEVEEAAKEELEEEFN